MKSRLPNMRRQSGSAVIYALIVLAAGAMVLTGWIHVLAARSEYTEQMSAALNRRMILENSRLLASEYLLENVLRGSYSGTAGGSISGWAGFALTGTSFGTPLLSSAPPGARNAFSPGSSGGYTLDIPALLSDGETAHAWLFQARSRNPIFGHDYLTSHRTTVQIHLQAGLGIADNAVIWSPGFVNNADFGMTTGTYQTPTANSTAMEDPANVAGQAVVMSDFAFLPVTSGSDYAGTLSVVAPGGSSPNSVLTRNAILTDAGVKTIVGTGTDAYTATDSSGTSSYTYLSANGAGTVTMLVGEQQLDRVYIPGSTSAIVLQGQVSGAELTAAGSVENPLLIVVNDPSNASISVQLQGSNNRRLYLAVKKGAASSVTISGTSGSAWRLAGVFEGADLSFALSGGGALALTGGLRTDGSVYVNPGTFVNISRESSPGNLELSADRNAWLEAYRE